MTEPIRNARLRKEAAEAISRSRKVRAEAERVLAKIHRERLKQPNYR